MLVDVDHEVGRAQQRGEVGPADLPGEEDPAVQAERVRQPGQAAVGQVAAQVLPGGAAGHDQLGGGDLGHGVEQDGEGLALGGEVGDGDEAVAVVAAVGGAVGGELGGVDAGGDDADVAAGDAEAGEVGFLVVAAGDDGVDGAADGGLEADPVGAGPAGMRPWRRSVTPSWSNVWMTGSWRSRAAARAARPLVQRTAWTTSGRSLAHAARSGALNAPIWAARRESSPPGPEGPTYSTRDAGGEVGPLGERGAVAAGVDGHLVALAGQAPAHLDQPGVVGRRRSVAVGDGGAVLGDQGDLHVGDASPRKRGAIFGGLVGAGTLKRRARRMWPREHARQDGVDVPAS